MDSSMKDIPKVIYTMGLDHRVLKSGSWLKESPAANGHETFVWLRSDVVLERIAELQETIKILEDNTNEG